MNRISRRLRRMQQAANRLAARQKRLGELAAEAYRCGKGFMYDDTGTRTRTPAPPAQG